jgi:DNA-binding transcriptional ArsR family regulator
MAVRDKKVDISALARLTGLRQPTVTFHVNELAKAGLVKKIKSGRNVFCVSSPPVCPHCPLFN